MNTEVDSRGAAVRFPPPLIFSIPMLAAFGVQQIRPTGIGSSPWISSLGALIVALGILLGLLAIRTLKRAATTIEPWKPTVRIVGTGVYAYSRNPIYLGFCLVSIGVGILVNSLWVLISFLPSAFLVYWMAIRKEERYLERKFRDEYLNYRSKVRRWL